MNKTLYQKYRPFTFNEVIGQDFIKKVLIDSIKNEQIQGTYLFSGPRGTGKTSIAKIFARAINCNDKNNPLEDSCDNCSYFKENNSYEDIYELDAASNNGVDDIRKIIESVKYPAIKLSKKVYIIDEVHMLSKGAFNALLKTLEEPNENCIFILATTEPNKIPATILSRCQRFDFSRIEADILINHLKSILDKENITYEEEIFEPIINLSDGCVRDALSLLQKLIIGNSKLDLNVLEKSLGLPQESVYQKILDLILKKDSDSLLKYWKEIYLQGINIENFIVDFQYFLKNILVNGQYQIRDKEEIINIIYKVNDIEQRAVYTKNLNSLIEIFLLEMTLHKKTEYKNIVQEDKLEQVKQKDKIEEIKVIPKVTKEVKEEITEEEIVEESNDSYLNNEINDTNLVSILQNASKEKRINLSKEFSKIGDELTLNNKNGLAKFFIEGSIKAVSNSDALILVEKIYLNSFLNKKEELLSLTSIDNLHIIDPGEWNDLKKQYLEITNNNKDKTIEKKVVQKPIEDTAVKKIEEKLNMKIKIEER